MIIGDMNNKIKREKIIKIFFFTLDELLNWKPIKPN